MTDYKWLIQMSSQTQKHIYGKRPSNRHDLHDRAWHRTAQRQTHGHHGGARLARALRLAACLVLVLAARLRVAALRDKTETIMNANPMLAGP